MRIEFGVTMQLNKQIYVFAYIERIKDNAVFAKCCSHTVKSVRLFASENKELRI